MKHKAFLLTLLFTMAYMITFGVHGQTDAHPGATSPSPTDAGRVLLDYSQFLRDETARHQQFLEGIYDKLLKVLAGIVVVFGAVFTWLQWRTRKEVEEQVNNHIDALAKNAIDAKLKAIDDQLQTIRDDLIRQSSDLKEQVGDINFVMFSPARGAKPRSEKFVAPSPGSKSILWVDDFPDNNDVPAEILRNYGVEIIQVLSTEQAMTALQTRSFDLIISDMGRGNNRRAGLDLLRELSQKGIEIPTIIFASARAAERYGDDARRLGAVDVTKGPSSLLNTAFSILKLRNPNDGL